MLAEHYFPHLTSAQRRQFELLPELYAAWNARINVISRKDLEHLEVRHILHSLAIGKLIRFLPGTSVLDAGTGGGFPGIPLAILFPETRFVLVDSIGKKIRVVQEIASALGLSNVEPVRARVETVPGSFDFITGRAVTALPGFIRMTSSLINKQSQHGLANGILYLKGGEFEEELTGIRHPVTVYSLSEWFCEDYFQTKKMLHIAVGTI